MEINFPTPIKWCFPTLLPSLGILTVTLMVYGWSGRHITFPTRKFLVSRTTNEGLLWEVRLKVRWVGDTSCERKHEVDEYAGKETQDGELLPTGILFQEQTSIRWKKEKEHRPTERSTRTQTKTKHRAWSLPTWFKKFYFSTVQI